MTFQPGLFVRPWLTNPDDPESVRGTGPGDARKALEALVPTSGVIDGLTVSGTTSWSYLVTAGHYAVNRPGAGTIVAPNDGPVEIPTDPAPGTGSRIDIIYVKHNDPDQGDPDGLPYVAVAKGVASGTPAPPAIPAGALELARKTVAAGDTNTSMGAGILITAARTGARIRDDVAYLTMATGWSAITTHAHSPRVTRVGHLVHLTGLVQWQANPNASIATIATVPTEFRPPNAATRFIGAGTSSSGSNYALRLQNGVIGIEAGYGTIGGGTPLVPLFGSWILD